MCEPVSAGEQHDDPKGIDCRNDNFTHILVTFWSRHPQQIYKSLLAKKLELEHITI